MAHQVRLATSAERDLKRLERRQALHIAGKLASLSETPRPKQAKKLVARDLYRLRIGNYRAIYRVDDEHRQVIVLWIRHRCEAYR